MSDHSERYHEALEAWGEGESLEALLERLERMGWDAVSIETLWPLLRSASALREAEMPSPSPDQVARIRAGLMPQLLPSRRQRRAGWLGYRPALRFTIRALPLLAAVLLSLGSVVAISAYGGPLPQPISRMRQVVLDRFEDLPVQLGLLEATEAGMAAAGSRGDGDTRPNVSSVEPRLEDRRQVARRAAPIERRSAPNLVQEATIRPVSSPSTQPVPSQALGMSASASPSATNLPSPEPLLPTELPAPKPDDSGEPEPEPDQPESDPSPEPPAPSATSSPAPSTTSSPEPPGSEPSPSPEPSPSLEPLPSQEPLPSPTPERACGGSVAGQILREHDEQPYGGPLEIYAFHIDGEMAPLLLGTTQANDGNYQLLLDDRFCEGDIEDLFIQGQHLDESTGAFVLAHMDPSLEPLRVQDGPVFEDITLWAFDFPEHGMEPPATNCPSPAGLTLSGRIELRDGSPAEGAELVLLSLDTMAYYDAFSDSTGSFSFTSVCPGRYEIHAYIRVADRCFFATWDQDGDGEADVIDLSADRSDLVLGFDSGGHWCPGARIIAP